MSLLIVVQLCYLVVLNCVRFVDSQSTVNDWSTACESKNCDCLTQCDMFMTLKQLLGEMQTKQRILEQQIVESKECETAKMKDSQQATQQATTNRRFVSAYISRTVADGGMIWGIAVFKGQLYIGRQQISHIEMYNISTLSFQRNLSVAGLGCTNDMTSCPECDLLFIADSCNNLIHVVDERGLTVNWTVNDMPFGLSVNSQLNVLVTFPLTRKLREFTPSGQLVREITLQSDINDPSHAIQLDNNRFAVGHGYWNDTGLHRVCIVNSIGTIIQSYGGNRGSGVGQVNTPIRLAVFGGSLIVDDLNNDRLLLFNSSDLTNVQIMMSSIDPRPVRITLNEDGSKLYLAANELINGAYVNGHVKVIDLMWN